MATCNIPNYLWEPNHLIGERENMWQMLMWELLCIAVHGSVVLIIVKLVY